jgi:hypothetical protein
MRFTEAERAEIVARMRELMTRRDKRVHIISWQGKWTVVREGARRASRSFRDKEDAVAYGRALAARLQGELVIHTQDGGLEAWEGLGEPSGILRTTGSRSL